MGPYSEGIETGVQHREAFADPRVLAVLLVWLVATGVGVGALWRFSETPGEAAEAPLAWPAETGIPTTSGTPTLLVFVHSVCDGSRATLSVLDDVLEDARRPVSTHVVVESGTDSAEIVRRAREIVGVEVRVERDELEARRFGVHTAGQVLLYDERGVLRFSGGITLGRPRLGSSRGADHLRALLSGRASETVALARADVFGCDQRAVP
ncbi:MAG: hypothetical protein K1X94_01615 [Sandaracinaceae bacterium]|jgi:nucleotide-binding universal stress UspA family protein|nr:hypothetical protein [Sandaracinaceae bacterium]